MTEQLALFDYEALAPDVRDEVEVRTLAIRGRLRTAAEDIIAIGGELVAVKAALGHGRFGQWRESEFGWGERTARKFIEVYERFKTANFADLTFGASALYALAAPSVPDEAVQEAVERAQVGEQITHKVARQIVAEHKPLIDPEEEPETARSLGLECFECGESLDDPSSDCMNCASPGDDADEDLEPADEVSNSPFEPRAPFSMPELEEPSPEERSFSALSRATMIVRLDPIAVAEAGLAIHPIEHLDSYVTYVAWLERFIAHMRERISQPIRSVK